MTLATSLRKAGIMLGILVVTTILSVMTGCSDGRRIRIGVSQCSTDDWRSKMNEEILREAMLDDRIEVEIRSADDDSQKQIADLDYFVDNGFDVIAVAPNEAATLTPKIRELHEAGIPVIVFDRTINGDTYTAFQGADNEAIGRMAAEVAATMARHPQVLEIRGLKGSTPTDYRHKGFAGAVDSLSINVLAEGYGLWNYDEGRLAADSLLRLYPSANVIYCHNDRMALGASDAARSLGRSDIRIIGVDAAPSIGIKAVDDGRIDATFLYPTDGYQLIRTATAIATGRPYEKNLVLPTPAPVDSTNARILLLQDKGLREETAKIEVLKGRLDSFSRRYSMQSIALWGAIAIVVLCAGVIYLLMRMHWAAGRHRRQMEQRSAELARQRDELDRLYRQLQEATGSKLTFFTNVSHDLRTPLTLIAAPIAELAEADNLTPAQHTLMQMANRNVRQLQRLIDQILDIRKYDSGQLRLNLTNVNLSTELARWTAPFATVAARRHIRFSTDIVARPAVETAVDVEKTERILFNLLSNAFKFTPAGGTISISLRADAADAVIRVADTGRGIPPEEINHIFERFFKTDRLNPNGSGIGLALSKVFIDMHGGSISVDSDRGRGTTFTLRLPLRTAPSVPAGAPETAPPVAGLPEIDTEIDTEIAAEIDTDADDAADEVIEVAEDAPTILVIDDNRDICTLIRSVLADRYSVLASHSGGRGIRLANKYVPDLIICDVMMPEMDGYQVCKALKGDEMTCHVPVLLLTACASDDRRREGYSCGADAFMSKPFDAAMLQARVEALLHNRQLVYQSQPGEGAGRRTRPATGYDDEFVGRFVEVVEREIANTSLTVEAIAATLGLSRVQMYRKIKAVTGLSATEMIRNLRLRRAAVMLKTTQATVAEVAYAVGFTSPGYFSRCYKDHYHETPVDTQRRTSRAR